MTGVDAGAATGPAPLILQSGVAGDILRAGRLLRDGAVLAVATDTVYGLSASVFRPDAIERVFRIKQRSPDAAVPLLLATAADLPIVAADVPSIAWQLIDAFWPGALTLVLPARSTVPAIITGGGRTVAVRVPAARGTLMLLQALGEPVIGTSANLSGQPPAVTASGVISALGAAIDGILVDDAVIGTAGPSTVVEVGSEELVIHREGAVPLNEIRRVVGSRIPVHR